MPDMKSLEIPEKDRGTNTIDKISGRKNFGFGTSLHLEEPQLDNLGFDKPLEAGTEVIITAKGIVEHSSEEIAITGEGDGKRNRMTIQLTEMALEGGEKRKDAAEILFGENP